MSTNSSTTPRASWLNEAILWLVTDRGAARPRTLPAVVELCIRGGVDAVVFREREWIEESELLHEAMAVQHVCHRHNVPFIVSHRLGLALELKADGLQLGVGDPPVEDFIAQAGKSMLIGFSCHSVDEAIRVQSSGVDYVFLGPVFPTPSKAEFGNPLGLQVVRAAARLKVPVVFIGGINEDNLQSAVAAGAQRVAAISALQAAANPEEAAREMRDKLSAHAA